jgi:hypothetical protein
LIQKLIDHENAFYKGNARLSSTKTKILVTGMSQIRLYEYMFQMWRIDPYVLCIRTLNHIWNMYSYNRIWKFAVIGLMESVEFARVQNLEFSALGACSKSLSAKPNRSWCTISGVSTNVAFSKNHKKFSNLSVLQIRYLRRTVLPIHRNWFDQDVKLIDV